MVDCGLISKRKLDKIKKFLNERPSYSYGSLVGDQKQPIKINTKKRKLFFYDSNIRNFTKLIETSDLAICVVHKGYYGNNGYNFQENFHHMILPMMSSKIQHIIIAINQIDSFKYDESIYIKLMEVVESYMNKMNIRNYSILPSKFLIIKIIIYFSIVSSWYGDNLLYPSQETPWYVGYTLQNLLENVPIRC